MRRVNSIVVCIEKTLELKADTTYRRLILLFYLVANWQVSVAATLPFFQRLQPFTVALSMLVFCIMLS